MVASWEVVINTHGHEVLGAEEGLHSAHALYEGRTARGQKDWVITSAFISQFVCRHLLLGRVAISA
jgi:hypothetical protein